MPRTRAQRAREPTPTFSGFTSLPAELSEGILLLSLPPPGSGRARTEALKILSLVCRAFRPFTASRLFPSEWTMRSDVHCAETAKRWRDYPVIARQVRRIVLNPGEWTHSAGVAEDLLATEGLRVEEVVARKGWMSMDLRAFTVAPALVSLQIQTTNLNFWCRDVVLPHLETLSISTDLAQWLQLDRRGTALLFKPSTLPSLRSLSLFTVGNAAGSSLYYSWLSPYNVTPRNELVNLKPLFSAIFPQLRLIEQNLLAPNFVWDFPPSTPILHTMHLYTPGPLVASSVTNDLSATDAQELDTLCASFSALKVRHLRVLSAYGMSMGIRPIGPPPPSFPSDLVKLLSHVIFDDLETLILPSETSSVRGHKALAKELKRRKVRLEFEEPAHEVQWSLSFSPSPRWREICRER
ncbi:hypothetical protein JCM10213_000694 [Rhodosporidiobolus nylandii]